MLCILSVFIPTFILNEPVRSLFMPLTLAVGFSMIASYLLSSTLVPMLTVWVMKHGGEAAHKEGLLDRFLPHFAKIVEATVWARWILVPIVPDRLRSLALAGGVAGGHRAFSPGGFRPVRDPIRAPPGSEYELTRKFAVKVLEVIDKQTQGKRGDLDGLRRSGRDEYGDQQHAALHARDR